MVYLNNCGRFHLFFLLLFFLSPPLSSTESSAVRCDYNAEQTVAKCLQPMLQYANELQEDTGAMQFPLHGGSIFHKLCSMYQQFMECVEEVHCSSLSVEAVVASYGFMCGSGMPLFEQHAKCFAEVEAQSDYLACKKAATHAMTGAQKAHAKAMGDAYLAEMCSAMDGYLRCSQPVILSNCGGEAWSLVSTVTRDSLRVTMPACNLEKTLF